MNLDDSQRVWLRRLWQGLRPLDPVRSIKMKLGLLVAASGLLAGALELYGVLTLSWRPRYSLALAVLISLLVSQLLGHGMTAPLRQMTAAARELALGRPAPQVHAGSRDEVGELARAFTAMSDQLAVADQQRRELLGNIGHELRTPVAALRAQLENLADGVRPADPAALAEALGQVERLAGLLNDLLDLARADAGAALLERAPVPIRALVDAVVVQVRTARGLDQRLAIEVLVQPAGLIADVDPHRLAQVLTNLVANAARHAPVDGLVQVWATVDPGGGLVIEVTDNGPGIPEDRWETVFERFRGGTGEIGLIPPGRSATSSGRSVAAGSGMDGGTGLGLAIARWAVALHGGWIGVIPSDSSCGCRIRVEIPPVAT